MGPLGCQHALCGRLQLFLQLPHLPAQHPGCPLISLAALPNICNGPIWRQELRLFQNTVLDLSEACIVDECLHQECWLC